MSDLALMLPPTDLSNRSEVDVVDDQWRWYERVRDSHSTAVEKMIKNDKYFRGEQWSTADAAKLDAEGRPHITINMILSTVNTLLGEHALKRANVVFEPSRGGTGPVAACLSKLWEVCENFNKFFYEEQEVLSNGLIQQRGWFDIRVEPGEKFQPVVRIRSIDGIEVIMDPEAKKYDPTEWAFVGRTWWESLDGLQRDFALTDLQVAQLMAMGDENPYGTDMVTYSQNTFGGENHTSAWSAGEEDSAKNSRRRYRVLEREYYVRAAVHLFVDPRTGDSRDVPDGWDTVRMHTFAQENGLFIHRMHKNRVRWTVTAGTVVVFDGWSPYRTFTKRPFFPYFRPGNPFGVVDNLISPQEQLNKIASQELHVINTTANSGWIVPKGSLVNMTVEELKRFGSSTGTVLETNPLKGKPEKIQPNQIPAALDRAENKALMNLMNISGVNPQQPTREPAKSMNGHVMDFLVDRTNVQTQVIMENLARTREMVVDKFVELVQDFMTAEQIVYMTGDLDGGEELIMNQVTAAGEVLNDVTQGTYKAVITMVPARDTYRENQLIEALALTTQGVPLRPERLVLLSSIEGREEIAAEVAADAGRGPVDPMQQQMAQQADMLNFQMLAEQVRELSAKINNLDSQTVLNQAKAQAAVSTVDVMMAGIEADVVTKRETNGLRQVLAQLSAASRMDSAALSSQTRLAMQQIKQASPMKPPASTGMPAPGSARAEE
jgi:hypothetical protein